MAEEVRRFTRFAANRSIPNEVKAAISKLGADPHGNGNQRKNMRLPDGRVLAHVANTTIGSIQDSRNLFQVLPDMDYARQILISATISPGDLTDTKVLYSIGDNSMDSNLAGPLLRKVQEFFDNAYRIRPLLHPILNDVMFERGSYPILVMPESSIDRIINADNYGGVSMESAMTTLNGHLAEETDGKGNYTPWGILGNPSSEQAKGAVDSYTSVSFESLNFGQGSRNGAYRNDIEIKDLKVSLEQLLVDTEENKEPRQKLNEASSKLTKLVEAKGATMSVTDNLSLLRRPMVVDAKRKIAVRRIYGGKLHQRVSLESRAQSGDKEAARNLAAVERSMYQKRRYQHIPVQPLMTHAQTGMDTYGHPLVMHLPSESVIPIHVPGNPSEHVGYYVMLDIDGNPISIAESSSYYDDVRAQMNNVDSYASQIIQQARRGFEGSGGFQNEIVDELGKVYSETVERDLLARLRSGALSGNYELGKTENINRIMFSRHMKGQKTIMLFVPPELMTYIAFDYNEFGVGKSVLEDGKILGSIRASIMLANTLATLNNAVGGKTIEIELDPEDEDPVSTVEFMLSEHAKVNSQGFSRIIGSTHPLGLADQIQNHGVNVVVSGNSRYPETKFNVNSRDGVNKPIDSDFEETMRKRHIQMFGLSPEVMEGINQADFATTVVQNNLMLLKRVIMNQEKFEPFLTDFIRRYILNSGIFLTEMRQMIQANKQYLPDYIKDDPAMKDDELAQVDAFLFEFIEALQVGLPSPEVGDIKKSMDSFDAYSEALDKVIDAYINEEMFAADTTIGMEELIPNIKAVVKAEFQRRWLRHHNVMPELDVFNTVKEEGDDTPIFSLLESTAEHLDGLNDSLAEYVKKVVKAAAKRAKVLKKIADEKAALEEAKNAATDTGGGMDGMDGGADTGGMDGLDGGADGTDAGLDGLGGEGGDGDLGGDDLGLDGEGTDGGDGDGTDGLGDLDTGGDGTDAEGADAGGLDGLDGAGDGADADAALDTGGVDAAGADGDLAALDAEGGEGAEGADADLGVDADLTGDGEGDAGADADLDALGDGTDAAPAEGTEGEDAGLDLPADGGDADLDAGLGDDVALDAPVDDGLGGGDGAMPEEAEAPAEPEAEAPEVEEPADSGPGGDSLADNGLNVGDLTNVETHEAAVDAENPELAEQPTEDDVAAEVPEVAEGDGTDAVEAAPEGDEAAPAEGEGDEIPEIPDVDADTPTEGLEPEAEPNVEETDGTEEEPAVEPEAPETEGAEEPVVEEPVEPEPAEGTEPAETEGADAPAEAEPVEPEEEEEESEEEKERKKNQRKADAAIKSLKIPDDGKLLGNLPDNPVPKI